MSGGASLAALLCFAGFQALAAESQTYPTWLKDGPAVFLQTSPSPTSRTFDHYETNTLNFAVWNGFIARTNGRSMQVWTTRSHPAGWPKQAPVVRWNTNSLIWGLRGLTALSPCWEGEGSSGQVPVTALSRRHGYARGHDMGPAGFGEKLKGKTIWFCDQNNSLVQVRVAREVTRILGQERRDYTLLLFDRDLPKTIEPMRVVSERELLSHYPQRPAAPYPFFKIEQGGNVSAGVPGFTTETWKGGDSGSADMLPFPGELVFCRGRSTSAPSAAMQQDMDELCRREGLNASRYQLQWVDLSGYPAY